MTEFQIGDIVLWRSGSIKCKYRISDVRGGEGGYAVYYGMKLGERENREYYLGTTACISLLQRREPFKGGDLVKRRGFSYLYRLISKSEKDGIWLVQSTTGIHYRFSEEQLYHARDSKPSAKSILSATGQKDMNPENWTRNESYYYGGGGGAGGLTGNSYLSEGASNMTSVRNYSKALLLERARQLLDAKQERLAAFNKHRIEGLKKAADALAEDPTLSVVDFLAEHEREFEGERPPAREYIRDLEGLITRYELLADETIELVGSELDLLDLR